MFLTDNVRNFSTLTVPICEARCCVVTAQQRGFSSIAVHTAKEGGNRILSSSVEAIVKSCCLDTCKCKKGWTLNMTAQNQLWLTKSWIAQLSAYNSSIQGIPCICTHSAPCVVITQCHSSLQLCVSTNKLNISSCTRSIQSCAYQLNV